MSGSERKKNVAQGYTIAGPLLFGSQHDERRDRLVAAGAVYDGKLCVWICPSREVQQQFLAELSAMTEEIPAPKAPPSTALPPSETAAVPSAPLVTAPPPGAGVAKLPTPATPVMPPPSAATPKETPAIPDAPSDTNAKAAGTALVTGKKILQLPPSYIVVQEVKVQGDIRYVHLEEEHSSEEAEGTTIAKTRRTTETVVKDPEEHQRAKHLAGQLRSSVRKLGQVLQSGVILVPVSKEKELDAAISDAKREATEFNRAAQNHFVRVSILKSIVTTDAEAASRDIAWKLQETMAELRVALESCDVEKIRSLTDNSKTLTRIIPAKEATQLTAALASANATRKYINEQVKKKGRQIEEVRAEVRREQLGPIESARMSFLEYATPVELEYAGATEAERFAELDDIPGADAISVASDAVNTERFAS